MPIANCYIKDTQVINNEFQDLATLWAEKINVDVKDICLTFIPNCIQAGQQYEILVNLYLPSLWKKDAIKNIQKSLLMILAGHFHISPKHIFIMTSIIQSGNVVENGEVVEW